MASAVLFADPSMAAAAGVPADDHITVSWRPWAKPNTYQIVANLGGVQTTIGQFIVPRSPFAGRIPVPVKARGPFTVAGGSAAMMTQGRIAVFSKTSPDAAATYDEATWEMLGKAGTTVSVVAKFGSGE
ncbi:hypothetical protein [Mesorhizobium sp. NZP2298]|uniref:hypothetical protein n=1 Tax=Mesorhizobium sp. NZP2298 TaxID=2483403 RepID=UPI001552063C|nr:hypothetical protein [Mesorhizobium sp. NZP2298]QKC98598.1 hypothetical protein EB231_31120 [Mesorhizobium sp. NZP2298]